MTDPDAPVWTTHRYRCAKVHASRRGRYVCLVTPSLVWHPPWSWYVLTWDAWEAWQAAGRSVLDLDEAAEVAGSGGSWQAARRRCDAAWEGVR